MRIERIRVDAFGRLREFDSGPEPLGGLVVVVGPNEAGKSTLFHFLTSMIYGFHPAMRDANPYAPWDGLEPGGSLQVRLDAGGCVDVSRHLPAQPAGRMVIGGTTEDIRNRPLPWAEHVPHTVFRQVYALTLADLAGLDDETWARVQDRIIGSMGSADLAPARKVVAELEQEAGELWRPNRRGNQRIRDIEAEILRIRVRRREAMERDRRIREIVDDVERARTRLQVVRNERLAARRDVDRALALVPIRTQIRRIAGLREEAGATGDLQGLPAEPAKEIAKREARTRELVRRVEDLRMMKTEPTEAVDAFGPTEARLIERGDDVASFVATAGALGQDRSRLLACEEELRELDRRLAAAAQEALSGPWDEARAGAIAALSIAEVRERGRRLREARELVTLASARRDAAPPTQKPPASVGASAALFIAGGALLAYGVASGNAPASAAGGVAAAIGLALVAVSTWVRRAAKPRQGTYDRGYDVDAASNAEAAARLALDNVLVGLPILPTLMADMSEALPSRLDRLQELLRDCRNRQDAAAILRARVAEADRAARSVATSLGLQPSLDAEAARRALEVELHRAERLRGVAAAGERELRRLAREEAIAVGELAAERESLDRLRARLSDVGGGDENRGIERVRDRLRARDRADQLQEELERGHADLDEILARIADAEASGEPWTTDEADASRWKAILDDLTEEAERLAAGAEALDRDVAHLREKETIDVVDSEIATLEEDLEKLRRDRDRRWIMAQILRESDRRFREEHQPDLVRRAGDYLRRLTAGRYDRIGADEASGTDRFFISGPGLSSPVDLAPPISTGTLEQAYLSLRFAIVDHLDQGLERLPLFIDEVFVNWDRDRRGRGMDLIESVARNRQLFVFTCNADAAAQLRDRGATILAMDPTP